MKIKSRSLVISLLQLQLQLQLPLVLLLLILQIPRTTCALTSILNENSLGPGLAWPNGAYVPMAGFAGSGSAISSYYTWSSYPVVPVNQSSSSTTGAAVPVPFAFIPMLWGCNATYTSPFTSSLRANFSDAVLTTDKSVLGFNEPEQSGQADCSPDAAAAAWKAYLEPLKSEGYRMGSPAVTSGEVGKAWMTSWFESCDGGCNPDFLAVHWYDLGSQSFIAHLEDCYATWNLPIWVTEYAPQNMDSATATTQATLPEIQQFMAVTTEYMDSVDWVERWFWFGAMYDMNGVNPLDSLLDTSGEKHETGALNALGVQYAGANGSLSGSATVEADHDHSDASGLVVCTSWLGFGISISLWVCFGTVF